ncbi:MAG: dynamin family protein [Turneriella sp.]
MTLLETFEAYAALNDPSSENNINQGKKLLSENSRVKVAFFGSFSAGKSALIGALLGKKVLPSKALPTTSKITTISNSKDKFIRIYYATGLQTDIPLAVDTQTTDEQVSKKVLENIHDVNAVLRYVVHFPIPDFPLNCELVDTPGINSSEDAHLRESEQYFEKADFVVYVLNGAQPLQATDVEFLKKLKNDQLLFVAINKIDLVDESEQSIDDVVASVAESLRYKANIEQFVIYPVSASAVLNGRDNVPGNRFADFQQKLTALLKANSFDIVRRKQERALSSFWPTLEQDYQRDREKLTQEHKKKSKKRNLIMVIAAVFIGLGIGGYFGLDLYMAYQLKRLKSGVEDDRKSAIVALSSFPEKSLPLLKVILDSPEQKSFEKVMALQTLTAMGRPAQDLLPSIRAQLTSGKGDILREAMKAYEATGSYDSEGIRQIKQLITHKDSAVAAEAIRTLRKIHSHGSAFDAEILDVILKHLLSDPDQTSEIIAYVASLKPQAERVGAFLVPLVKDGAGPYSLPVIDALTKLGFRSNTWRSFLLSHSTNSNDPLYGRVRSAMEISYPDDFTRLRNLEESRSAELQNTVTGESSGSLPAIDTYSDGKKIQPTSVTASSSLTEDTGYVDRPEYSIDGKLHTAWADGNPNSDGIGEWLQFNFPQRPMIASIGIVNGFAKNHKKYGDLYYANARPKVLDIIVNGELQQTISLRETREMQYFKLNRIAEVRTIRLVIKAEYPGSQFSDTCISEVVFLR